MLDTPYGFQVNADDLTHRTVRYFAESVGHSVESVRWRSRTDDDHAQALAQISQAAWLFAGPGSPTYALSQWHDTPMPGAINDVIRRGGTVVLGSAAAVTAGRWALPVYEIYKVGTPPHWVDGLDLLSEFLGLRVAVIPHFDNAEGGTYDTRYCYLGEDRLKVLEEQLDDGMVLGVDEHTAVIIDVDTKSLEVVGSGVLTVRRSGESHTLPSGTTIAVSQLEDLASDVPTSPASAPSSSEEAATPPAEHRQPSLDGDVDDNRVRFDEAIADRNVNAAVEAVLAVEQAIEAWSADTLQSDSVDRARRELRAMIVRLGDLVAAGMSDPRAVLGPVVEEVLAARSEARDARDFAASDLLRDVLVKAGITVNDTPDGVEWDVPNQT
jgi:hypothetical protein